MEPLTIAIITSSVTLAGGYTWYKLSRRNTLKDREEDKKEKQQDKASQDQQNKKQELLDYKTYLTKLKSEFNSNLITQTLGASSPRDHFVSRMQPIKRDLSAFKTFAEMEAPKLLQDIAFLTEYIGHVETHMETAIANKECNNSTQDLGKLRSNVLDCEKAAYRLGVDMDSLIKFGS